MDLRKELDRARAKAEADNAAALTVFKTLSHLPPELTKLIRFACKVEPGCIRADIGMTNINAYWASTAAEPCERPHSLHSAFKLIDQYCASHWELLPIRSWIANGCRHMQHKGEPLFDTATSAKGGYSEGYYWTQTGHKSRTTLNCVLGPTLPDLMIGAERIKLSIALNVPQKDFCLVTWKHHKSDEAEPEVETTWAACIPGASEHRYPAGDPKSTPDTVRHIVNDRELFMIAMASVALVRDQNS